MKRFERELGKRNHARTIPGGAFHRLQSSPDVVGLVRDRMLLHERQAHGHIIIANESYEDLTLWEGDATTIHSARRTPSASR